MNTIESKNTTGRSKERIIGLVYITFLVLLIANDHVFKFTFHNFVTGKLSDLLGVICLTLLIYAFVKPNKVIYFVSLFLIFLWWKSPYSTDFITFWNNQTGFHISRVVDYSDLLVLLAIPLVFYFTKFEFLPQKAFKKTLVGLGSIFILASSVGTHGAIKQYGYKHSKDDLRNSFLEFWEKNPEYLVPDSLALYTKNYNNQKMDSDSVNFYLFIPSDTATGTKNTIFWLKLFGNTDNWHKNGAQLALIGIRNGDYTMLKTKKDLSSKEQAKLSQSLEKNVLTK